MAGTVDSGKEKLTETTAVIGAAKAQADEVVDQLGSLGAEGRASAVAEIADAVEEAQSALTGLGDKLDEIRTAIEAAKGLQRGGSTETAGPAPRTNPERNTVFSPRRRNRAHENQLRRLGWPRNASGRTSARGLLYDTKGDPLSDQVWKADPRIKHADLREPWASADNYVSRWHVEGQVAAWMRQTGTRKAVLYLNIPPCGGGDPPDPVRCEASLKKMLPKGYTLDVHTVLENGGARIKRYTGTGEAIR